ncbi:monofunctional biosynthetic peptidoglycan transglycosylase [Dechloromonas sp. HYN0024]|uniref:monofunctional biosynthetic peptidoglycan transglycosylase n=1 Tax=Dechloromonas sp. HYN0024 TaxID=2231055 RepID=UPI000E436B5B|nr:monofunctional biosynthetic peptidoglycan transglycosylase [Dechloromonas sp. HYN0024]AXS81157.1 monofunctional biosynthetic peptidoglycan transglycosylase [Dechloromonas sp. HYN0024]
MRTVGRWLKWGLLGLVGLFLLWQLWLLGWVLLWGWVNPGETRFMQIRLAELRQKVPDAQLKQQWVPYERISVHLKRAIIAAEDAKFVDHEGFDWEGIQKAMEKNQKKGRYAAGGSTISQQLAKNLFLTPSKSYFRKAEEAIITLMLENLWSKRRIFEVYLNVIEWGNGVFGAEAAARHYYSISAAQIGPEQAARLAGMVPNPRLYDRNRNAPGLARKTAIIIGRMSSAEIP